MQEDAKRGSRGGSLKQLPCEGEAAGFVGAQKETVSKQTAVGSGAAKPVTTVGAGALDSPAVLLSVLMQLWANTRKTVRIRP